MKVLIYSFLIVIISTLFNSCKKNELGGQSIIKGSVYHHSRSIANARVFIKFNATEFPGQDTTLYDANVWADAKGTFSIKCYKGNYYLYGYGFDNLIPSVVKGGIPVKIRNNETLETDVFVTDAH